MKKPSGACSETSSLKGYTFDSSLYVTLTLYSDSHPLLNGTGKSKEATSIQVQRKGQLSRLGCEGGERKYGGNSSSPHKPNIL